MIVAKVAATPPQAGTASLHDDAPADAAAFSQLLNEKKAASGIKPSLPARGQMKADATSSEVIDEVDGPAAEVIGNESLLVFLNQFRDSLPTGEALQKEKQPQENELPGSDLSFGSFQPLLTYPDAMPLNVDTTPQTVNATSLTVDAKSQTVDATSLTFDAAASDENSAALADRPLLTVKADTTAVHAEEGGTSAFTLRSVSAAGLKSAISQQDLPAAIPSLSADSAAADQSISPLPLAINTMPLKGAEFTHSAERVNTLPDLALSPTVVSQPASAAAAEPSVASGQLVQQMGTPAWQQSLGQQIACFTRDGIQHAELRLHPEELGSIQITLELKNEQAQMHFVSASHQVRAAIEAAVPHLRTSLAESGIELGQSSVGADSSSGWKDSGQPEHSARHNFAQAQRGDSNQEERIETPLTTVSYNNGINTFV